eukprot:m.563808 g.563808  ORF g.563808 m.563808 type:complete len:205 (+) comp22235_c4_seq8:759-1373(+)
MRERLARRKYQRQGLHGVPNGEWCAVHGQVVENAVPMVPLVLRGAVVFVGNTADALPLHLHGCGKGAPEAMHDNLICQQCVEQNASVCAKALGDASNGGCMVPSKVVPEAFQSKPRMQRTPPRQHFYPSTHHHDAAAAPPRPTQQHGGDPTTMPSTILGKALKAGMPTKAPLSCYVWETLHKGTLHNHTQAATGFFTEAGQYLL